MHNHILSCEKEHQNPNENDILTARYHRSDTLLWIHVFVSLPARLCINDTSILQGSGWNHQTKWDCTAIVKIQVVILLQLSLCLDLMCLQGANCMQIWKVNVYVTGTTGSLPKPPHLYFFSDKHCPPFNHQHLHFSASGSAELFHQAAGHRCLLRVVLNYDRCDLLCKNPGSFLLRHVPHCAAGFSRWVKLQCPTEKNDWWHTYQWLPSLPVLLS